MLGTGRDGRVLKEDILNYVNSKQGSSVSEQGGVKDSGPFVQTPVQSGASNIIPGDRVEPMKGYTRAMVKSMTAAIVRIVRTITVFMFLGLMDVTVLWIIGNSSFRILRRSQCN